MGLALMTTDIERAEYTEFGVYAFKLMIERNIRTPTEMARRIIAKPGYPLKISGQTVGNYLKGIHRVPPEFLHYATAVLNDVKPLTSEEREQLGQLFAWRQRHPGTGAISAENMRKAQDFIKEADAGKGSAGGAAGEPGSKGFRSR